MSDAFQTANHPVNHSVSKQLYSFAKATRFDKTLESSCRNSFYDPKVTALGRRAPSFGYGNKISLEKKEKIPAPGAYDKQSEFNKRRGYSFGHDAKKSIVNEEECQKIPGPGKYSFKTDKDHFVNVSFTMREKLEDPFTRNQNKLGPGQYATLPTLNPQGKYFISKYGDSGCGKFGNTKRFDDYGTISPGPGKCTKKTHTDEDHKATGINKTGSYFYSTYRTTKANKFDMSPRKPIADPTISPGPGA